MITKSTLVSIVKKKTVLVPVVSGISFALGAASAYLITSKTLEAKYVAISEKEIEEAKAYYEKQDAARLKAIKNEAEKEAISKIYSEKLSEFGYSGENQATVSKTTEVRFFDSSRMATPIGEEVVDENVFATGVDEDGEEYSVTIVDKSKPYIIRTEEYLENDTEYAQINLTYFEGDEVLVDDQDQPVRDVEGIVGEENLNLFGVYSGDKNVLYVRNEKRETDFEILKSSGKYVEEVLGYIDHSDDDYRRKNRKFRSADE